MYKYIERDCFIGKVYRLPVIKPELIKTGFYFKVPGPFLFYMNFLKKIDHIYNLIWIYD